MPASALTSGACQAVTEPTRPSFAVPTLCAAAQNLSLTAGDQGVRTRPCSSGTLPRDKGEAWTAENGLSAPSWAKVSAMPPTHCLVRLITTLQADTCDSHPVVVETEADRK